jgi:hypothetical protein
MGLKGFGTGRSSMLGRAVWPEGWPGAGGTLAPPRRVARPPGAGDVGGASCAPLWGRLTTLTILRPPAAAA